MSPRVQQHWGVRGKVRKRRKKQQEVRRGEFSDVGGKPDGCNVKRPKEESVSSVPRN